MDDSRFDALTRSLARPAPRRTALHLLSAALLGTLLPVRPARAQRADSDGDGLPDDDEVIQHGTDPNVFDTDGDGAGDGAEVAAGTNPRSSDPPPAPALTCIPQGGYCSYAQLPCCGGDSMMCCPDALGDGYCTDLGDRFTCPTPAAPATGCPAGQTDCGGICTNLSTDHGNCGACGHRCSQIGPDYSCMSGACGKVCAPGLTSCSGVCVDLYSDVNHCGACYNACGNDRHGNPGICLPSGNCAYL